ncbi:T9SS type A sorting domain-containing protein [Flavobacterium sp. Sd200]|uniref:Ig-like domain-containing protein n=1 Tax=Flavobacterium sp. Sd200 TaxID=2692211 RepID=UPI00136F5A9C|nr:Ig-like domain-containing protein [Flavobacterium sp. Sd200]MXN91746.1 T9SS type A sorting domain-containing protein [Flavobacterium sp. Sd200]
MKKITLLLAYLFLSQLYAQSPVFYLKYNEANATTTVHEEVSNTNLAVTNQFGKPERVTGVTGNALRTDGFSTWIQTTKNLGLTNAMTFETWVVLESFPADAEVPYSNLTPSAIVSQTDGNNGMALFVNAFGVWNFTITINGAKYVCQAPGKLPLYAWTHLAVTVNGPAGTIKLYQNGAVVATATIQVNGTINAANTPLIIGKSNNDKFDNIFLLNAMNAAFDETKIYTTALTDAAITNDYNSGSATITTTGEQAIAVSPVRFSGDLQRPTYHAMPPANWTNEPHGMVEKNGTYHLFYQRTPNGPFKTLMHWGHMTSTDFINWNNTKDALWPELNLSATNGYDMKGIWSGDVVMDNGTAHAFYTAVNHTGPYNPGIGHATSTDADLKNWVKTTPVIDKQFVDDFRDPYLFKDGATWVMLIGAAVSGSGGLDCYTSTNLITWTHKPNFCTVPYSSMDIGSVIWEMPVFESLGNGKYILIVNPIGGSVAKYGPKYTRGVYWIGTYTGGQFTPDYNQPKMLDLIPGHLSPTVARNASSILTGIGIVDERRSSQAQKDAGWCHVFSLPRVYSLLADNQTLGQAPAPQTVNLRVPGSQQTLTNVSVSSTTAVTVADGAKTEIIATVNAATTASSYGLNIRRSNDGAEVTRLYYDAVNKNIILDKSSSSLSGNVEDKVLISQPYSEAAFGKPQTFHVFIDNSIIDVFINEKAAFSARIYPSKTDSKGIQLYSNGGTTTFTSVVTYSTGTQNVTVPVTSVALNKTTTTIPAGATEQLTATVSPINASNQNVAWTSSNAAIATVNTNGLVTAISPGTAIITVTTQDGSKTAGCTVTVNAQSYVTYDFESANLNGWTVTSGTAFTAANVAQDLNWGWGGPFNQQGTWHFWGYKSTGDTAIGEMRTTANFTLGGNGIITFKIGGGNDINNLYIALCNSSGTVLAKETGSNDEAYTVKTIDASAYIGTNCFIKVVDNSTGGFGHINLDDIKIPVASSAPVSVTGVTLNKTSTTLTVSNTETLLATVAPANATNQNKTWTSSNTAIATISSTGVITAVAAGTATITVTTQDGSKTASCVVTVAGPQYLVLDFETGDLTGWTTLSGTEFVAGNVCNDVNWGWGGPFNKQGTYHFWGFKTTGDTAIGAMKSQNFTLGGDGQISYMIGGGNDINNLYIALCRVSDDAVLLKGTATTANEAYVTQTINAASYVGSLCYIKAVDNATGGFGHINLDNIRIPVQSAPSGMRIMPGDHSLDTEAVGASIKVYPVPVTDVFTVDLTPVSENDIRLSITDITGKNIVTETVQGGKLYTYSTGKLNMAKGFYMVTLEAGTLRRSFKIIVN